MRIALYPGSFDPVTLGHVDIMRRAAKQFDRLIVCVMVNSEKHGLFLPEERAELIRRSLGDAQNISVDCASGLLVDYARSHDVSCVVKGLRSIMDFEVEKQMADINRGLDEDFETMFLTSRPELAHISSTIVKEMARYGVDLHGYVSNEIKDTVAERMRQALEQSRR